MHGQLIYSTSMPQSRTRDSFRQTSSMRMKAPAHPFPELQGPFEESMTELERTEDEVPSDAAGRRTILLDAPTYERVIAGRWKQRPGEQYHPLWKIVAQLSFGIHLLSENLAKSEEEVMVILQGHIDEVDMFLERTTEDFALAQDDVAERMRCLQLPLQHPKVFDRMLEDRAFRNSIVDGNEKIEHIVSRTGCAMKDSLKDAQKGLDATNSLGQYLAILANSWGRDNPDHEATFEAMLENVEGWRSAFVDLHVQGEKLGRLLKQLTEVINQMQQRAGEVSRRLVRAQQKQGHSPTSSRNITYISHKHQKSTSSAGGTNSVTSDRSPRKALPGAPHRERLHSSQSHRPPTSQSTRSATSQRSGYLQPSRTTSRTESYTPTRDPPQPRMATKSPRIVEIRRNSPQGNELSQTTSTTSSQVSRSSTNASHAVELPTEISKSSNPKSPLSVTMGMNAGLGITQSGGQVFPSKTLNSPTSTGSGTATDAVAFSRLPMTPSSMASNGDVSANIAHEMPSQTPHPHTAAPSHGSLKHVAGSSVSSPPSTPAWAKQNFDVAERNRMVMGKTPFRSHPPHAELGSPPVLQTNKFHPQAQYPRVNESMGSMGSSVGAPGPEMSSSDPATSVKSGSAGGSSTREIINSSDGLIPTLLTKAAPTSTAPLVMTASSVKDGKKVFVAELEGITPMKLRSAARTQEQVRSVPRELVTEPVELDAPLQAQPIRPMPPNRTMTDSSIISKISTINAQDGATSSTVSLPSALPKDSTMTEEKMAAAIRQSFIAKNIELPGTPVTSAQVAISDTNVTKPEETLPQESATASADGLQDIIKQLDELSATTPDLNLKTEEALAILPSTTYSASKPQAPRSPTASTLQRIATNATTSSSRSKAHSPSAMSRSKPEPTGRNSSESTASSQSQWRAFFKGQLSPSSFNSSSSQLPMIPGSGQRTVVEQPKQGQESSPTLGWQWSSDAQDVEVAGPKAINVQQ